MNFISILLVSLFSIGSFSNLNHTGETEEATFYIKKGFSKVNGQFNKIDYQISLDEKGYEAIYGTADIKTVTTGNATRDKHLQNKEWFDAANHPKITIQSKKIFRKKEGEYVGTFDIIIKGKTETKEIPFQVVDNGNGKLLKANFTLSIGAFDIGGGVVNWLVGDKVTINLNLSF